MTSTFTTPLAIVEHRGYHVQPVEVETDLRGVHQIDVLSIFGNPTPEPMELLQLLRAVKISLSRGDVIGGFSSALVRDSWPVLADHETLDEFHWNWENLYLPAFLHGYEKGWSGAFTIYPKIDTSGHTYEAYRRVDARYRSACDVCLYAGLTGAWFSQDNEDAHETAEIMGWAAGFDAWAERHPSRHGEQDNE